MASTVTNEKGGSAKSNAKKHGSVAVRSSVYHGKGLFATKDIRAGELIFKLERPLVATLDTPKLKTICSNCFLEPEDWSPEEWEIAKTAGDDNKEKKWEQVRACAGCGVYYYCSVKCQTEAWKRCHKEECKVFRCIISGGPLPNSARVLLNMIRMTESEAQSPFSGLKSHMKKIRKYGGGRWEHVEVSCQHMHRFTKTTLELDVVQNLFCMIMTNSLTLVNATYDPIGICLDPLASKANHSCDPNAVVVHDGAELSFRSLQDIPKNEEVFISYVDCTDPPLRRQYELNGKYFIICDCPKCLHNPDTPEEDFRLVLPSLPSSKPLGELSGAPKATELPEINDNDYLGSSWPLLLLGSSQKKGFTLLEDAKGCEDAGKALELLNKGLKECKIFPVWRQPVPSLMQQKFFQTLVLKSWIEAWKIGIIIVCLIDPVIYPLSFHPVRVVHVFALAKLTGYIFSEGKEDKAVEEEVATIEKKGGFDLRTTYMGLIRGLSHDVNLSHGPNSRLASKIRACMVDIWSGLTGGQSGTEYHTRPFPKPVRDAIELNLQNLKSTAERVYQELSHPHD